MDLKTTIKRNLFFKVDFDGKYKKKKSGKIEQSVRFFLIGVIPVVIDYKDGGKERAIINAHIEVKQDPYLRMLHGAKYNKISEIQRSIKKQFNISVDYKKQADEVLAKATRAINSIGKSGEFQGKKINSVMIINIGQ